MNTTVVRLKNYSNLNILDNRIRSITVKEHLAFALDQFYSEPIGHTKLAPRCWSPIFFHFFYGLFDPFISYYSADLNDQEKMFNPWEEIEGIKRTLQHMRDVKKEIEKYQFYKDEIGDISEYHIRDRILSKNFIYTREVITKKTVIIGILDLRNRRCNRFLIKNVKKICHLLREFPGDFPRLLGGYGKRAIKQYNRTLTSTGFKEKTKSIIVSANNIPVQDENVSVVLKIFGFSFGKVYKLY